MQTPDFAKVARKSQAFSDEMSGKALERRLTRVGTVGQREVTAATRATIGDLSMSGWTRRNPIQVRPRFTVKGGQVTVRPGRAAGPMRVLESGREARASGAYREYQANRRDGSQVTRRRKVRRNVGAMAGKGVWSRAERGMSRSMPRELTRLQRDAFRKAMT
jgi:hypothetical protein